MREKENDNILYVKMLGGFSMNYNGVRLEGNFREMSQFSMLMQMILHHRRNGISKDRLKATLFEDRDMEDVSHSLRNGIYTAKQKLRELGLPDIEYFQKQRSVYFWTDEIEVVEDAEWFETSVYEAMRIKNPEERFSYLLRAVRIYTGKFLPHMEGVQWIEEEQMRLSDLFRDCIWEIDSLAEILDRYQELYDVSMYASKCEPYSCWEVHALKALVAMNKYDDAEKFYETTLNNYVEHEGSESSKNAMELRKGFDKYIVYRKDTIDNIQAKLTGGEDDSRGGFFCPFSVFRELYRSIERVMMRTGDHIFMMLCTIRDEDEAAEKAFRFEAAADVLQEAVICSVRRTDTVTKYGKGQFLVLLIGTTKENCHVVQERIEANYKKNMAEPEVEYEIVKVVPDPPEGAPWIKK